jgi:HEAT repeat protein
VPALRKALADPCASAAAEAARALGRIGPEAAPGAGDLKALALHRSRQVREAAREALERILPGKP